jgi:hypothetical protein
MMMMMMMMMIRCTLHSTSILLLTYVLVFVFYAAIPKTQLSVSSINHI